MAFPSPDPWSVHQLSWILGSHGPEHPALAAVLGFPRLWVLISVLSRQFAVTCFQSAGGALGLLLVMWGWQDREGRGLRNAGWHLGYQLRSD